MTERYAPMLANVLKDTEIPMGWQMEPKYDGHRIIVAKFGDTLSLFTRTFHNQLGKVPHIEESFNSVPFDFVLDGELISISDTVEIVGNQVPIANFESALSVVGSHVGKAVDKQTEDSTKLSYVAFDCLHYNGDDTMQLPDAMRRNIAEGIVDIMNEYVLLTPRWQGFHEEIFDEIVAHGGEGIMLKNGLAAYSAGKRPKNTWSKLKDIATADVVVMGFKPGNGKYADSIGAVEFGQYKNGILTARSRCSGMDDALRNEISDNREDYLGKVMEVKYFGRVGPEKSFRHPVFKSFRDDKLATDCVWE